MKFEIVDKLPVARSEWKRSKEKQKLLDDFLNSDAHYAKIKFADEYKSPAVARVALIKTINRYYKDRLKLSIRNGELYLIRL